MRGSSLCLCLSPPELAPAFLPHACCVGASPLGVRHTPTHEWGPTQAAPPPDNCSGALWVWGLSLPPRAGALRAGVVADAPLGPQHPGQGKALGEQEESRKPQFPHLCPCALKQHTSQVTHPGSRIPQGLVGARMSCPRAWGNACRFGEGMHRSSWETPARPPGSQGPMPAARPPAKTLVTPVTQTCHPSLLYKMTPITKVGLPGTPGPRPAPLPPVAGFPPSKSSRCKVTARGW